jgi:hypothetical protein
MLFATSFFDMVALNWLFRDEGLFFSYLLLLVVIYIRNMGIQIRFGIAKKMKPLMWILIGALISFIPAYLYYGQHLYYSFIVYRNFFGYFALVVLLSIRPSHLEIRRALNAFSVIYFASCSMSPSSIRLSSFRIRTGILVGGRGFRALYARGRVSWCWP